MAYIGVSPSNGVRQKHTYTATASQTSFSGAGAEGISLSYLDSNYVDVYQNGVKLSEADYTSTTGTTVVLATGATVSDMIEIIVYDVFSVADTVSKADGGTFDGAVTFAGGITGPLAINDGDAGSVTANTVGDEFVIESSGAGGLSILTPNASDAQVLLGGPDTNAGAILRWNDDANLVSLGTNNTGGTLALKVGGFSDALTIDASANVTITGDIRKTTSGTSNFAAGVNAGNSIQSGGNYNTVVGDEAGTALTTGDENVAIGFEALKTEDANGKNTAVGYRSLSTLNAGADSYNTAFGHEAGRDLTTGIRNIYVGGGAGKLSNDADHNVAIGHAALANNLQGDNNVAVGSGTLQAQNIASSTDTYNTAVGYNAGLNVTTGVNNTLIGGLAGDALTDADLNVALGYFALSSDTLGGLSTAIGYQALKTQNFTSATSTYNVAVGYNAGVLVTTGVENTLIGALAGDALTDADRNTAIGYLALTTNTKSDRNTAIGRSALENLNSTSVVNGLNVAVGHGAGSLITTGQLNTIVGASAGDALTSNGLNTLIGQDSGTALDSVKNTFVGQNSGSLITSGEKNTIIGRFTGNQSSLDIRTADNHIVLSDGDGNPRVIVNGSGSMVVGSVDHSPYVGIEGFFVALNDANRYGAIFGCDNIANREAVIFVNPNGQVGSIRTNGSSTSFNTSSDHRLKESVEDMTGAIDRVKQLSPKRFNFITDSDTTVDGFLAHEAQTVVAEAVTGTHNEVDDDGNPVMQGIDQAKIVPLLTGALKEAIAKIEDLETRIATLEGA